MIEATRDGAEIAIRAPFACKDACKSLPGRRWHPSTRTWRVPATTAGARAVSRRFDGQLTMDAAVRELVERARLEDRQTANALEVPAEIPALKTTAWEHQRRAYAYVQAREATLLAMGMGSGKSLIVVADVCSRPAPNRTLILCPLSVIPVWRREFDLHAGEPVRVVLLEGLVKRKAATLARTEQIYGNSTERLAYVTNHESAWRGALGERIKALDWDLVCVDESHRNKKAGGKFSLFIGELRKCATRRVCLTGTPMSRGPIDLYSQYRFLDPGIFGTSFVRFRARYCNPAEAPIWMGDLSFKRIAEVSPGDEVIGWIRNERESKRRRLIRSKVRAVSKTIGLVVEVKLQSGRTIRCTPEHRWLSYSHGGVHGRNDVWTTVGNGSKNRTTVLSRIIDPTPEIDAQQQRSADWLAGIYDGEGSRCSISQSISHNPEICEKIECSFRELGIPYAFRKSKRKNNSDSFSILGGRQSAVNFLNWTRDSLVKKHAFESAIFGGHYMPRVEGKGGGSVERYGGLQKHRDAVISVSAIGFQEVFALETETGNYICWGYASSNSVMGGFKGREIVGYQREEEFDELAGKIMFQVRTDDVLDLPEATHVERYCDLSPEERRVYRELERELVAEVKDGTITAANGLVRLLRLAQVAGGHSTAEDGRTLEVGRSKEDLLREVLEEIGPREPIVIFCRFREELRRVRRVAEALGREPRELSGERKDIGADWLAGEGDTLAVQIQAGSVGLSLTRARYCLYFSVGYSLVDYEQSLARVRRPGQDRPVTYVHLVAKNTVDQAVYAALLEKKDLVERTLESLRGIG